MMKRRSRHHDDGADRVLVNAVALGALTGMRSMAGSTLLSRELVTTPGGGRAASRLADLLASPVATRALALLSGGEMLADKTSLVGDRIAPAPLVGRAIIGSLTAAAYAGSRRHPVLLPSVLGAGAAIGSAFAAFHLRRIAAERFDVPDRLLGMVEDAIVVAASRGIASAMED